MTSSPSNQPAVAAGSHGSVGQDQQTFVRLLPPRSRRYDPDKLRQLADQMIGNEGDSASNEPDGEENLLMPAGYTYFGQFIDHDLTFDTTSSLGNPGSIPTNLRTPRLDLDCLYGTGPDNQPYLYAARSVGNLRKGVSLVPGRSLPGSPGRFDLPRIAEANGDTLAIADDARAIIGDPRNDENAIVCNLQAAFISFHNRVVEWVEASGLVKEKDLFVASQKIVRWTYQKIVVRDYLRRLIDPLVYESFRQDLRDLGEDAFVLYPLNTRQNFTKIPLEFAGAAYRFGHSMIRTGYKLNTGHDPQKIFTPDKGIDSLVGFGRLRDDHWIEWNRFFPENDQFPAGGPRPLVNNDTSEERLQWAYRIDTSLVDPLKVLPAVVSGGNSLADLNLRRGDLFRLASGQSVASVLGLDPLSPEYLVVRDNARGSYGYIPIDPTFHHDTPLWFYVLAEAQRPMVEAWLANNGGVPGPAKLEEEDLLGTRLENGQFVGAPVTQLGPVGGRILLETFYGLLFSDPDAYGRIKLAADMDLWRGWLAHFTANGERSMSMATLLQVAGLT
jgi:hypothetical protein